MYKGTGRKETGTFDKNGIHLQKFPSRGILPKILLTIVLFCKRYSTEDGPVHAPIVGTPVS